MAGLLNCPVPIPSINTAQTGQSAYATNPASIKWSVYPDEDWGLDIFPWRDGILILPNGDTIHCMFSYSLDVLVLVRVDPTGALVWMTDNLSVGDDTSYSNLVIDDNNKIYIGTQGVYYTAKGGLIICVDAETGIKEWEYDVGAGKVDPWRWSIYAGPVVHPITGDIIVNHANLVSVDSNGNLNWEIVRDGGFDEHGIAISPYNNLIYTITFGGSKNVWVNEPNYPKQMEYYYYDSKIYAFDTDGNEIYSYVLDEYGAGGPFHGIFFCDRHAPLITPDGTILIGSSDNTIAAFNPDLTLKWSTAIYPDYNNWGLSMISNGALSPDGDVWYCPDWYGYLYAIDVATGAVLWDVNVNTLIGDDAYNESGLIVDSTGKILYVCEYGVVNYLATINPDGTLFSVINLGIDCYVASTPAIAPDGTVYLNDYSYGYIFAVGGGTKFDWTYGGYYNGALVPGSEKIKGYGFYVSAAEWNALIDAVTLMYTQKGLGSPGLTKVSAAQSFTAALFNQVRAAIGAVQPTGILDKVAGDQCLAADFNQLRTSLNLIT